MTPQLLISVLSSKRPLDGSLQFVSRLLPGIDLAAQQLSAVDAPVQALATEDADFDLCHVEPTGVLGRVVKAHAAQQFTNTEQPNTSSKHFLKCVLRLSSTR